jgi:hypothetical protein
MIFDPSMTADVLRTTFGELQDQSGRYLPVALAAIASGIAFDYLVITYPAYFGAWNLVYLGIGVVVQALTTRIALTAHGRASASRSELRLGALFGLGILMGLAGLAGLIMLVLPFFYIMGRLFLAVPMLLDRRAGVSDAMRDSWSMMERHWMSGAVLVLLVTAVSLTPLVVAMWSTTGGTEQFTLSTLLANIVFEAARLFGLVAAVVLYLAIAGRAEEAAEVFS